MNKQIKCPLCGKIYVVNLDGKSSSGSDKLINVRSPSGKYIPLVKQCKKCGTMFFIDK